MTSPTVSVYGREEQLTCGQSANMRCLFFWVLTVFYRARVGSVWVNAFDSLKKEEPSIDHT